MKNISSIDKAEVEKFSKLAKEWWDPKGNLTTLHQINPVRLKYIRDKIIETFNEFPQGVKILDIGCGGGLISVPLTRIGAKVTGIDASKENIETAQVYAKEQGLEIEYICTSAEIHRGEYDVVLAMEIIEHVPDYMFFVNEAARLLKPGGCMILSTLNRTKKAYLLAIAGAEYVLRWVPIGTHEFNKFVKPSEMDRALRQSGMKLQELKGISLELLTKSWKLCDDIDVNYMAYAIK